MTLIAAIAVLVIGGLLGTALLVRLPRPPGRLPVRIGPPPPQHRPPVDLMRITDIVTGGIGSAGDVHRRVRPLLREIAAGRLAAHQVALDRDVQAARELLGEPLWELVRADRPAPVDPRGSGISRAELAGLIDRLAAV